MKIYVIVNVGNEIEGRLTSVKLEKAYKDKSRVEAFMKSNKTSYIEETKIENDTLKFFYERNVQEIEIED